VGTVCFWEFSGYESYFITYDQFIGDCNSIYIVVVSMKDLTSERQHQLHYWLDYLRCRKSLLEPIGTYTCNKMPCYRREDRAMPP